MWYMIKFNVVLHSCRKSLNTKEVLLVLCLITITNCDKKTFWDINIEVIPKTTLLHLSKYKTQVGISLKFRK